MADVPNPATDDGSPRDAATDDTATDDTATDDTATDDTATDDTATDDAAPRDAAPRDIGVERAETAHDEAAVRADVTTLDPIVSCDPVSLARTDAADIARPRPVRLPTALYVLLMLQILATAAVAIGLFRVVSAINGSAINGSAPRPGAATSPTPSATAGAPAAMASPAPRSDDAAVAMLPATLPRPAPPRSTIAASPNLASPSATAVSRPSPLTADATVSATPAGRRPTAQNLLRGPIAHHIALTFDGGANSAQAQAVLDALHAKGVHSTLFLTGEFIRAYPDVTRRIVAEGHEVGNHTMRHPHLAKWVPGRGHVTLEEMTRARLLAELEQTRALFHATTHTEMTRYWRAPYGEVNAEILRWAADDGWKHVGWTTGLDTLDWVSDPSDRLYRTAAEIRDRLLVAARSGDPARGGIVLMHLGADRRSDQASLELPHIIDGLRAEGYRLVTISALVGG